MTAVHQERVEKPKAELGQLVQCALIETIRLPVDVETVKHRATERKRRVGRQGWPFLTGVENDADTLVFGEVLGRIDLRTTMVAVTADHSTSSVRTAHTDDPVPLVVAGGTVTPDGSPSYGESVAAKGSLGTMRGPEIVPMLVGMMRE